MKVPENTKVLPLPKEINLSGHCLCRWHGLPLEQRGATTKRNLPDWPSGNQGRKRLLPLPGKLELYCGTCSINSKNIDRNYCRYMTRSNCPRKSLIMTGRCSGCSPCYHKDRKGRLTLW